MPDTHPPADTRRPGIKRVASDLLRDAARMSWRLFKVMVPVSIAVRLLAQFGLIEQLGDILSPLMHVVGLPGKMGLVWATTLVTTIYGGMAAYAAMSFEPTVTTAQITILGTMMLIAHALPLESGICRQAGPRLRVMVALRLVAALLAGWLLHLLYSATGWHSEPARMLFGGDAPTADTWGAWALKTGRQLGMIFLIILALLVLLRVLARLGITRLLIALLRPVLRLLGISEHGAPLTIIGMTLGLSYGGGLIIEEARSGRLKPRDVLFGLALMSIAHSLIEDTLLLTSLGARALGTLWMRLAVALVLTALLVQIVRRLPDRLFYAHLFVKRYAHGAPQDTEPPAGETDGSQNPS